jgi:hypothetical protein
MNKKLVSFVLAMVLSVGLGVSTLFAYSYSKYGKEFSSFYAGSTSSKSVTIKVGSPDDMLGGNLTAVFGYYAGSLVSYQAAGGQFQLYDSYGARFTCNNAGGIWSVTGANLRTSDLNDIAKFDTMEDFLMSMGFTEASLAVTEMDEDGNIMTTTTYGEDGYYGSGTISKEEYERLSETEKENFDKGTEYKEDGYHNAATGKTITEEEYKKLDKKDQEKFVKHKKGDKYYTAKKGMISKELYGKLSAEAQKAFTYHNKGDKKAVKDLTEEETKDYKVSKTAISGDLLAKLRETLGSGANFSASISVGSGVTGPSLTISENGKPQITYTSDPTTGGIRPTQLYVYDDKGFQVGIQTATFELDSTSNGEASGHWTCNYTAITYDKNGVRTDTAYQFFSWSDDPQDVVKNGNLLSDIPAECRYGEDGYYDKDGHFKSEKEWEALSNEDKAKYTYKSKGTVIDDKLKEYMDEHGDFDGQISSVTHYSANNSALYSYDYTTNQTTYFANNRPSYIVNAEGETVGLYSYTENGVITAFFNANGTDNNGQKVGTTTIFDQWGRQLFTAVGGLNDGSNPFKNQAERQKLIDEYYDMIANGNVDPAKYEYDETTGTYKAKPNTGTRISSLSIYADQMFDKNSESYEKLTKNGFLDMNKVNAIAKLFSYSGDDSIDVSEASLKKILKKYGLDASTFDVDGEFDLTNNANQRDKMDYDNNSFVKALFNLISAITGKSIDQLKKSGDFSTTKDGKLTLKDGGKSAKKIAKIIKKAATDGKLDLGSMLSAIGVSPTGSITDSTETDMIALYVLAGMLDMLSVNTGFNGTGSSQEAEDSIREALATISDVATDMVDSSFESFKDTYTKSSGQRYINVAAIASKVNKTASVAVGSSLLKVASKWNKGKIDEKDANKKTVEDNFGATNSKAAYSVSVIKDTYANRNGGSLAALNQAFGGALNMSLAKFGYTGTDIVNMLTFCNGGATAVAQTTIAMSTWDKDNIPGIDDVDGSVDMSDVNYTSVTRVNGEVTTKNSGSHIQYSVQNRESSSNTRRCAAGMTFTNTILLGGAQAYSKQHNVVTDIYEVTDITVEENTESDPAVEGDIITDGEKLEEAKANLAAALGVDEDQIEYKDGVFTYTDDKGNTSSYVAVDASKINLMDGSTFHAAEGETVIVQVNTRDKDGNLTSGVDEKTIQNKVASGETRVMFMGDANVGWSDKNTVGEKCLLMTMNTSYNETSLGAGDGGVVFGQAEIDSVKAEIEMVSMVAAGKSDEEIRAAGYDPEEAKQKAEDETNKWIKDNTDENMKNFKNNGFSWDDNKDIQEQLKAAWQLLF